MIEAVVDLHMAFFVTCDLSRVDGLVQKVAGCPDCNLMSKQQWTCCIILTAVPLVTLSRSCLGHAGHNIQLFSECSNFGTKDFDQVNSLWTQSRLSDPLIKYLTDLGVESLSDFVNLVDAKSAEEQLATIVLDQSPEKGKAIQLSRLRSAWQEGQLLLQQGRKRRLEGISEDPDEPLDETTSESLQTNWQRMYGHRPDICLMPSDVLLGKVYREFQRGAPTLIPIRRVTSLFKASQPVQKTEVALGSGLKLQTTMEPGPVRDIVSYYLLLRVLANAYALAGSHKVASVLNPSTQVTFTPLRLTSTIVIRYCGWRLPCPIPRLHSSRGWKAVTSTHVARWLNSSACRCLKGKP